MSDDDNDDDDDDDTDWKRLWSDKWRRYYEYKIGIDTAIRPFRKKIFESIFNGTSIK